LKRYIGSPDEIPQEWQRFIRAIDAAYQQADDDRALLERSLELTSEELVDRFEQLRQRREELEVMVKERTIELEHRTIQLQAATEVAHEATSLRNLNELLDRAVTLIRERFEYYHTSIYLVDDLNENAILMAATGEPGRLMLEQNHRLALNTHGIICETINASESRIVQDISDQTPAANAHLLPETQSEMALPLRIGERVIGAISVHSSEKNAFSEHDVPMLQTLADQLAVAISNTRLLQEMQQTLQELEVATSAHTQEAWEKVIQRPDTPVGFRYRGMDIEPIHDSIQEQPQDDQHITLPIRFRGQEIGAIDLNLEQDASPETSEIASSIAERLALALENARLLEETQHQADEERLIAEITSRLRETLSIDMVLKTAVREMRSTLGLHDVLIHLDIPNEQRQASLPSAEGVAHEE
jgi:GAF domain-containing protein